MNKIFLIIFTLLCGCQAIKVPEEFVYKEIQTSSYKLASWQKITNLNHPIRIYIEGDGHAFNYAGRPTSNPTPRGTFLREMAFNDSNPNVVYLARPCQFVEDSVCTQKDWTTGRFSKEIVNSTAEAIKSIVNDNKTVLIGYSGGALLSGLVINQNPDIKVQRWITIAGLLNHTSWTKYFNDAPLIDSLELQKLPNVKQMHFIGEKDKIIPMDLAKTWSKVEIVPNATHDAGWDKVNLSKL